MWRSTVILVFIVMTHAQLDMTSDKMMFEDNIAEESRSDEIFVNTITSKPILNDGKPFYVARDPTTGTFDFNMKKTVGISNDIPVSRKDELTGNSKSGHDINSLGQNNFHDYLNLPVKYSSSKFVYPLISGSYANLKYQGNNKNQVSNHKNYTTTLGTTTQSPKYFTHITNSVKNEYTATFKHPEPTKAQTEKPTTPLTTTTQQDTTPSESSTVKYSSTIVQNSFPSTFKNKYVDSSETRKKTTIVTTTSKVPETSTLPANPVKFLDDLIEIVEKQQETKPTTYRPHLDVTRLSFSTSMPLAPSAFKPLPTDVPKNQSQKISFEKKHKNPSIMSLSEIIHSFTGNDDVSSEQNSIPYDSEADSTQVEINKILSTFAPVAQTPSPVTQHKTLQQQLHNHQQTKPQYVDLPVHQNTQFAPPNAIVGFPTDHFDDYVEFENPADNRYAGNFVKYEVQKPNVNLVKFQQAPSMNNVVISPGQNSASFVLGSQQNVGSVGIGSSLGVGSTHFADKNTGPMKVGQVINDEPPMRTSQKPNQVQGSIRFPSEGEQSYDNAQIVKGVIKDGTSVNVQPPQALLQNQPQKPLVFPSNEQTINSNVVNAEVNFGMPAPVGTNPSQIIFENVNDIYEKIHDKKQKQEITSNELSNNIAAGELTPPQVLTPPSPGQQRPFNRQQQQPQNFNGRRPGPGGPQRQNIPGLPNILPQFRPNAKASQGHQHIYKDVGAIRVQQGQGPYRQHSAPISLPKLGLPPMMGPPGPQNPNFRRLPNRPFTSGPTRMNGPSRPQQHPAYAPNFDGPNRRVFQVPPPQIHEPVYMNPPPIGSPQLGPPGFQLRRPVNGAPETMQMQQRPSNIPQQHPQQSFPQHQQPSFPQQHQTSFPQQHQQHQPSFPQHSTNFPQHQPGNFQPQALQQQQPDSELSKSSPPPAVPNVPTKHINEPDSLEPVITLQMLQNKKGGGSKLNLPAVPHDISQDIQSLIPSNHKEESGKKPSIYVVYPVSSDSFESTKNSHSYEDPSVIVADRDDIQIPSVSEYQNTPFSVVSHFEQEPLLMKKDKKKNQFPYHLERPAHSNDYKFERPKYGPSHDGSIYNMGETPTNLRVVNKRPLIASEHPESAISSKLTRVTEKPIAIAYTPTEPNRSYPPPTNFYNNLHPHHYYTHQYDDKYSVPNYGGPVISEILDEKHIGYDYYHRQQQLQQHLNNGEDLDFYKEHYDFQAPFHASVSLNPEVTNPYEGWNIVTQSTDTNKIDRSDLHVSESSEETSTRKFDPNEFQPVFESGFQPIYSGNKVSTAPEITPDSSEFPTTFAITYSTHPNSSPSSTTTTTTPSPTTSSIEMSAEPQSREESTTKVVEKKKQKVEIDSLEAFFESLTRDYDEDESTDKSENENSSRSL